MNQNNQKLVVRDYPVALWLFGVLTGGYALYTYFRMPSQTAIIAAGAGISALIFLLTTVVTVTADRQTGMLTIRNTGILIHRRREIPIAEIAAIELEHSYSSGSYRHSAPTYRIVVFTKGNEKIPLRASYTSGRLAHEARLKRLRQFLNVGGTTSLTDMFQGTLTQAAEQFRQEQESITGRQDEERVTDGVRWTLQTRAAGGAPLSVWHSPDFHWPDNFLYLVQKAPGQQSTGGVMALMSKTLLKTSLNLYGFRNEMTLGMERASQLAPLDPQLEPHFMAFTSDPAGARQILNPWVQMPLAAWVQKYPVRPGEGGSILQLVVLFCPQGVYLAMLGLLNPEFLEELTRLGVELVKAQGGTR